MAVYYRLFQATVFLIIVSINAVLWKKKEWKGKECPVLSYTTPTFSLDFLTGST